ncbi:MAG TPA: hypothetical protein PKL29_09215 [Methanothrix sp.]|nr:hypothetical protein [Methanothrix sp.]
MSLAMNETLENGGGCTEVPSKLKRTARKLAAAGEEIVQIAPAILHSRASEQMLSIARMGMLDKVLGYLVTTDRNVHFVRPGLAWDSVQTVPLNVIDGIEYVDEFHNCALKIKVGEKAETITFYEDMDGIWFYQLIKKKLQKK